LAERALAIGLRILKLAKALPNDALGREAGRQVIRCETSIGANVREADHALSDRGFTHEVSISRKEPAETEVWLDLLIRAELIVEARLAPLRTEAGELISVLSTIVQRMHQKQGEPPQREESR
jgi:four helix bundle protein